MPDVASLSLRSQRFRRGIPLAHRAAGGADGAGHLDVVDFLADRDAKSDSAQHFSMRPAVYDALMNDDGNQSRFHTAPGTSSVSADCWAA